MEASAIESIDLSKIDFTDCVDFEQMFQNCTSLKRLDLGDRAITRLQRVGRMFKDCESLKELNLMCIQSPSLRMSNSDYLPHSKFCGSNIRTRTFEMFAGINKSIRIQMPKELLDIIEYNRS